MGVSVSQPNFFLQRLHCQRPSDKCQNLRSHPHRMQRVRPPMKSFLSGYDLGGKTVIPFNTNGGYGLGSSLRQIQSLCPDSNILDAFATRGGLERDGIYHAIKGDRREEVRSEVKSWLRNIAIQ